MNEKAITKKVKPSFFADILGAIGGAENLDERQAVEAAANPETQKPTTLPVRSEKLNAESALVKTPTLTARLNAMIAAGVSLEIAADNFQAFGASERENVFLQANKTAVLCTLQQGFLQKELFRHSPDLLEAFQTEVGELSAAMTDGGSEIVFEAVCKICADWIAEAIAKL